MPGEGTWRRRLAILTSPPQPCSVEVRVRGFPRTRPPRGTGLAADSDGSLLDVLTVYAMRKDAEQDLLGEEYYASLEPPDREDE